jgi:hypothetical protein
MASENPNQGCVVATTAQLDNSAIPPRTIATVTPDGFDGCPDKCSMPPPTDSLRSDSLMMTPQRLPVMGTGGSLGEKAKRASRYHAELQKSPRARESG